MDMTYLIRKFVRKALKPLYEPFLRHYMVTYEVYHNNVRYATVGRTILTCCKLRAYHLVENNSGGKYRDYSDMKFRILKVERV